MPYAVRNRRRRRGGSRGSPNALVLIAVMALAVVLFRLDVLGTVEPLDDASVTGCDGQPVHLSGAQAELMRLHNEARKDQGLTMFCVSRPLTRAASAHSRDMLEREYYDHDSPDGRTPAQRVEATGYAYSTMAENIHMREISYPNEPTQKDLEQVFEDWMDSPGHRANLLNPELREIGIGAAFGNHDQEIVATGLYTVDFGTPW